MAIKKLILAGDDDAKHQDALDATGYWGKQGAGCLVFAKETKRFLLMLRGPEVEQPRTWGTIGGAIDEGENQKTGAMRELVEESKYKGKVRLIPMYVFSDKSFRYSNFLAIVPAEFKPRVDWENIRGEWFAYGEWPKPLHFGLKKLLKDPKSVKVMKTAAGIT
jgi:8-oxo-dGTP pyrophosphatase MutT (NUDIX family)